MKEQVESLGAEFIELETSHDAETSGGYAAEMSDDFYEHEQNIIGEHILDADVVITTAQIFGKRAPLLITKTMVESMRPGSVIVDLAVEAGGNCELSEYGKTVRKHGVTIIGHANVPLSLIHISAPTRPRLISYAVIS